MLEIGIPVYNAKETLAKALDSLVVQTSNDFIVCLSIDGDKDSEFYIELAQEYVRRGLKIRIINSQENGGPGMARQRVIDSTECDYITFLDSDDILMPRAVETLYYQAKKDDFDIVRSSFIRENKTAETDYVLHANSNIITWCHGKIYKVDFLKKHKISFLPNLRVDEDAYFNLITWNCAINRGELDEITYIWRYNKNSLTRKDDDKEYFKQNYLNYITSQVKGLQKLYSINNEINDNLVLNTLFNIYYYYMKARFYKLDEISMNELLFELKEKEWVQKILNNKENWKYIIQNVKPGDIYDDNIVFFEENFCKWIVRLLVNG